MPETPVSPPTAVSTVAGADHVPPDSFSACPWPSTATQNGPGRRQETDLKPPPLGSIDATGLPSEPECVTSLPASPTTTQNDVEALETALGPSARESMPCSSVHELPSNVNA